MNHTLKLKLFLTVCAAVSLFSSCQLDPLNDDLRKEMFTRNFIKEFGLIDPEQDWNMATERIVKLDVGEDIVSTIKVYAKYGSEYFLVADLEDLKGKFEVPVDVPKDCQDVMVRVNGATFYGQLGVLIDCTDHPTNRSYAASRATKLTDDGTYTYDSNNPWYTKNINGIQVSVSEPATPYIYFNAQQMAPVLQKDDAWKNYWSMSYDGGKWQVNTDYSTGILPEIGDPNKNYYEGNAYKHQGVVTQNFVYKMGDPEEGFDIYPMFYGSNLRHTLGIYLLDEDNKEMRYPNDYPVASLRGKIIKIPIYQSKHGDDLQVKIDKYENEDVEKFIKVKADGSALSKGTEGDLVWGYPLGVVPGTSVTISFVYTNNGTEGTFPSNWTVKLKDGSGMTVKQNNSEMYNGQEVTGVNTFTISSNSSWDGNRWVKFQINGTEFSIICYVTDGPKTTNIKSFKFFDGNNEISDAVSTGIVVPLGQSKEVIVKCYDGENGTGNIVSNDPNLYVGNWQPQIFTINSNNSSNSIHLSSYDSSVQGYKLNIYGVSASEYPTDRYEGDAPGVEWAHVFVDLNGDYGINEGDEPKGSLKVSVRNAETHSHTETYTIDDNDSNNSGNNIPWPMSSPTWDSHFYTESEVNPSGAPKRNVRSRASTEITIWEDETGRVLSGWNYDNVKIEDNKFKDIQVGDVIKIYVKNTGQANGYVYFGTQEKNENIKLTWNHDGATDFTVTSDMVNNFKTNPWVGIGGTDATILKVSYVTEHATPVVGNWHDGAQAAMKTALEDYYAGQTQTYNCDVSGHSDQLVSGADGVSRTITVNVTGANKAEAKATVSITLSKTVLPTAKPGRKAPKAAFLGSKNRKSAARKKATGRSRAGEQSEYDALTSQGGALYHDNNTEWHSIRKVYIQSANNGNGSADSYEYSEPLLVKSRGYRVKLINPVTKQPWEGYFGMYIDYDWGLAADVNCGKQDHVVNTGRDNSVKDGWTPGGDGRPEKGTHYSQSHLNELVYDGRTYPISYAATFTHPKSTNKYLCFEDWDVTLPSGDVSTTNYSATYSYNNWSWVTNTGHYSSDRDLNDIIYRQVGLIPMRTSQLKTNNMGFDWIWALEDLGSTDDFDFNDLVIRINSITKTVKKDNEASTIVKNVSFTPLAAGGTLPVYIHYKFDNDHDFILKPSPKNGNEYVPYDLVTLLDKGGLESGGLSTTDGMEFHSWFGGYSSTTMINTGAGPSVTPFNKCEILVPSTHSMNINGKNMPQGTNNSMVTVDANGYRFYVTIKGPIATTTQENIDNDRLKDDTYTVSLPEKGAAAQSFLIVEYYYNISSATGEVDENISKVYAKPWYWPRERVHIMQAYPNFKQWINNASNTDWWQTKNSQYLYEYKR